MKALVLFALLATDVELKKEASVSGGFVTLLDLVKDPGALREPDKAVFNGVYLGAATEGRVISKTMILFGLRYRGIDPTPFNFLGDSVRVTLRPEGGAEKKGEKPAKLVTGYRAVRDIRRNRPLKKSDFEPFRTADCDALVTSLDVIWGARAARHIKAGETLTIVDIRLAPVVRRGKQIVIKGSFIDNVARALSDGAVGEVIECVVKDIKDPIKVKVVSEGVGAFVREEDADTE